MLKLFGCMLTVAGTSLLGMYAALELDRSYRELGYLYRLLGMIQGEMRYSKKVLSHIFLKLSRETCLPYNIWLRQMGNRMEARNGGSVESIWKECIDLYLKGLAIPKQDKERLQELGESLGEPDIMMQLSQLDGCREQFLNTMEEMKKGMNEKKKLFRCIGVTAGIFLAVLLI